MTYPRPVEIVLALHPLYARGAALFGTLSDCFPLHEVCLKNEDVCLWHIKQVREKHCVALSRLQYRLEDSPKGCAVADMVRHVHGDSVVIYAAFFIDREYQDVFEYGNVLYFDAYLKDFLPADPHIVYRSLATER